MDYSDHYLKAKEKYVKDNKISNPVSVHPSDFIKVKIINKSNEWLTLDKEYYNLVNRISKYLKNVYDKKKDCDVITSGGKEIAMQYKKYLKIDGVKEIAEYLVPQLERNIFHCNIMVDRIFTMRSIESKNAKPISSWLWHYDNQPKEVIKIMIYLNDVGKNNAPFEILNGPGDFIEIVEPTRIGPSRWTKNPDWPTGRVPKEYLNRRISEGASPFKITGKKGQINLFDNNCIHRANLSTKGYRDVVILRIRPTINAKKPYVDSRWTFSYWDFGAPMDPRTVGGDKHSIMME